jgi:methoxymalonate biosynthesis acyl carrier protein
MGDDRLSAVRSFIGRRAGDVEIDNDQDIFASIGLSSLFAIQLVAWIERTYDIPMKAGDLDIANFRTVNSVVRFINSHIS